MSVLWLGTEFVECALEALPTTRIPRHFRKLVTGRAATIARDPGHLGEHSLAQRGDSSPR